MANTSISELYRGINNIKAGRPEDALPETEDMKISAPSDEEFLQSVRSFVAPMSYVPQSAFHTWEDTVRIAEEYPVGWGQSKYDNPLYLDEVIEGQRSLEDLRAQEQGAAMGGWASLWNTVLKAGTTVAELFPLAEGAIRAPLGAAGIGTEKSGWEGAWEGFMNT
ncbi:MAG: hypothetical protein LBE56_12805 [Tannerella sp.]|jgi:hypothetical protein|nr:hypothetical protein [Tannerella sp.]